MITSATKSEIVSAVRNAPDADAMWVEKAVQLIDVLDGTPIDMKSNTLLNDMLDVSGQYPNVKRYLTNLPGVGAEDWSVANQHLEYGAMQIRSALGRMGLDLDRTTPELRQH